MNIQDTQEAFNRAKEFFVEGCGVYFVTSDGNVFLLENKNFAYLHAEKRGLKVFEVEKKEAQEIEKPKTKRGRKK